MLPKSPWIAAAQGAFALPFFILPALLTIDAPDIHGGHAIHVRQALALAAAGGVVAAVAAARPWRHVPHWAVPARIILASCAMAAGLILVAVRAADHLATLFRIPGAAEASVRQWGLHDPWGPGPIAALLVTALAGVHAFRLRTAPASGRPILVAFLATLAIATTRFLSIAEVEPLGRAHEAPLCLVLIALTTLRLPARQAEPRAVEVAVGTLVVVGLGPAKPLAWLVLGLALFLARRFGAFERVRAGGRQAWGHVPAPARTARFALAIVIAAPASLVAIRLAPVAGAAIASAWPDLDPNGYRALPPWTIAFTLAVTIAAGLHAAGGGSRARTVGIVTWVLAGFTGACALGTVSGTEAGNVAALLIAASTAMAGTALSLPHRVPDGLRNALYRALPEGPTVLGAMVGAAVVRILGAAVLPVVVPPAALLSAGAALGSLGAVRSRRTLSRPFSVGAAAGAVAIGICAAFLPMFVAVAYGVNRGVVLGLLTISAVALVATPLRVRWVVFGTFYGAFAVVALFKTGPAPARCKEVAETGGATLVFPRFGEDSEGAALEPYDVLPVPGSESVLVSFKRYLEAGGHLALIDTSRGVETSRIRPGDEHGGGLAAWPERIEWDEQGGAWVQILASGEYAMWRVNPEHGTLTVDQKLPLNWEPGNPGIDAGRSRLVLTYVPNRQASNPLLEAFDLMEGTSVVSEPPDRLGLFAMADYVAVDPGSGRYYAPAFFDLLRFAVVVVDGDDGNTLRRRETFHPSVGIAADGERVYLTNATASTLDILDAEDLTLLQRVPAGAFPRDLVFDRGRARLYVAGYGDGEVRTYDVSKSPVRSIDSVRIGPLLRGLGLDPVTGRVFGASGCGVFEIPTSDDPAPGAS